jgi:class 3 adenylate cyclase
MAPALQGNLIEAILPYGDSLLLGSDEGLAVFSPHSGRVERALLQGIRTNSACWGEKTLLWAITSDGIVRIDMASGRQESLTERNGLRSTVNQQLFRAQDGSIWLPAYRDGLCQIRLAPFASYGMANGLQEHAVTAVLELPDGRCLMGTDENLYMMEEGYIRPMFKGRELGRIKSLRRMRNGQLLVCSYRGLWAIDLARNQVRHFTTQDGLTDNQVRVVLEDSFDTLWVGTRSGGVMKCPASQLGNFQKVSQLENTYIMDLVEVPGGNILVGTNPGGLNLLGRDGRLLRQFSEGGSIGRLIMSIRPLRDGGYLVANDDRLTLLGPDFEERASINSAQLGRLPGTRIFDTLEDGEGDWWLSSADGVLQVLGPSVRDYREGRGPLRYILHGESDGMKEPECTGAAKMYMGRGGRFYVPTMNGLSLYTGRIGGPAHRPPPAYITKATLANGQAVYSRQGVLEVPADANRVQLSFTALDFLRADQLRFEYRLGTEKEWTEAGPDRHAVYTYLPPGRSRFELRISYVDGDSQGEAQRLSAWVFRAPRWHERLLVRALLGLLAIGAVTGGVVLLQRKRVRRLLQQRLVLEREVAQRTEQLSRQAAQLEAQHDRLESSYQNLKLLSEIGREITQHMAIEGIIDTAYAEVTRLMPADGFGIGVYSQEENRIEFPAFIERGERLPPFYDSLDDRNSLSDICFQEQRELFIRDWEAEKDEYLPGHVLDGVYPRSMLYLPLLVKGKPVGNLTVQSFAPHAHSTEHLYLLRNIAMYVSIALENAASFERLEEEKETSERLLLNILPKHTALELKEKGYAEPRTYEGVTVLFTDFKGFTESVASMRPERLVNDLDYCFRKFDKIVQRHGLEKIKTIGDAYMAVAGLGGEQGAGAEHALRAAVEIRDFMARWQRKQRAAGLSAWDVRMGMHSGSIIAGVVGTHKFAFDIWGDTVNTAARMEAASLPGMINLSDATYREVQGQPGIRFEYRGEMEAKGKGKVGMWFAHPL